MLSGVIIRYKNELTAKLQAIRNATQAKAAMTLPTGYEWHFFLSVLSDLLSAHTGTPFCTLF
jgi:hypothetical protein